eukprot:g12964.t1
MAHVLRLLRRGEFAAFSVEQKVAHLERAHGLLVKRGLILPSVEDDSSIGYLLKYQKAVSDFQSPVVRECRGIIVDGSFRRLLCYPFDFFFVFGEGRAFGEELELACRGGSRGKNLSKKKAPAPFTFTYEKKYDGCLIKVVNLGEGLVEAGGEDVEKLRRTRRTTAQLMVSTNNTIDARRAKVVPRQNDEQPPSQSHFDLFEEVVAEAMKRSLEGVVPPEGSDISSSEEVLRLFPPGYTFLFELLHPKLPSTIPARGKQLVLLAVRRHAEDADAGNGSASTFGRFVRLDDSSSAFARLFPALHALIRQSERHQVIRGSDTGPPLLCRPQRAHLLSTLTARSSHPMSALSADAGGTPPFSSLAEAYEVANCLSWAEEGLVCRVDQFASGEPRDGGGESEARTTSTTTTSSSRRYYKLRNAKFVHLRNAKADAAACFALALDPDFQGIADRFPTFREGVFEMRRKLEFLNRRLGLQPGLEVLGSWNGYRLVGGEGDGECAWFGVGAEMKDGARRFQAEKRKLWKLVQQYCL